MNDTFVRGQMPPATQSRGTTDALAISVNEVARRCGVHRNTIGRAIAEGRLASIKVGRRRMIPVSALREMFGADAI